MTHCTRAGGRKLLLLLYVPECVGLAAAVFTTLQKGEDGLVGRIHTGMWRHDGPDRGNWLGLGRCAYG